MNGKFILIGTIILCPIVGCVYLYARNRKLEKALDVMTAVAKTSTNELKKHVEKEEK